VSRRVRVRTLLVCAAGALAVAAGTPAARALDLGFSDGAFTQPDAQTWLQRSVAAGADMVRIDIGWVAPQTAQRPPGFNARNPADPHYNFTQADTSIKLATQLGLRVLVTFTGAPPWAEGPGRPPGAQPGSWRPSPSALEDYGAAIAKRYSGGFPDPADPGHMLPRVAAFQVWNEPNLSLYLSPQWSNGRAAAPVLYRQMLNAFYRGVKSVNPRAVVVTAGTAPFGDPGEGSRIPPVTFWRDVLCLKTAGSGLAAASCPDPAHFDVLAHHPYAVGSPTTPALDPGDVSIADLAKLTTLLRAAERFGTALPRERRPLWITEVDYNSYPPDPGGVPINEQARWLEQTLAVLSREGAQAIFWEQVGDQPPIPSYGATAQSGVYYLDGQPKPALSAYRFPFVAWRMGRSSLDVWGRAPASGRLLVQQLAGSRWKTIRRLNERRDATFLIQVSDPGQVELRAQMAGQASLVWHAS
jgi:Cellulase (glycosyl hydrolase family 5)